MPAPDNMTVELGSCAPSRRVGDGEAVRKFDNAAIAPGREFALRGVMSGGGNGPV